eukprot:gene31783-52842_t
MMVVMAPTPLVMVRKDHTYLAATLVMMVHMFLMFAPSPVTGALIGRAGTWRVMLGGGGQQ